MAKCVGRQSLGHVCRSRRRNVAALHEVQLVGPAPEHVPQALSQTESQDGVVISVHVPVREPVGKPVQLVVHAAHTASCVPVHPPDRYDPVVQTKQAVQPRLEVAVQVVVSYSPSPQVVQGSHRVSESASHGAT